MSSTLTSDLILGLVDDRPTESIFRLNRRVFTDPDVFELEMRCLFEGGWVFLGLTSQVANNHDFFTTRIGRQQLLVTRDHGGQLHALINSCPHKGARVCAMQKGNAKVHVCPYHSWSFDSSGKNKMIKGRSTGAYSENFDRDSHNLSEIPRLQDYHGFLFGSLVGSVPPLEEYLGEARHLIDLVADQSSGGLELVPGVVSFTYAANWKLQLENCSDQYHFSSVHPSYLRLLERRSQAAWSGATRGMWDPTRVEEADGAATGGSFTFDHGHVLNWRMAEVPEALPLYEQREQLAQRVGEPKRDWMLHSRNLTIFPNLQIAENASSQLRIIRPISVDRTEMLTFCIAPVGESPAARRTRIRQYEDFFNPSGLATPDDAVVYEACQEGYASKANPWLQGYSRGMTVNQQAGNRFSDALGMKPASSITGDRRLGDETIFHGYYRAWRRRLSDGLAADPTRSTVTA